MRAACEFLRKRCGADEETMIHVHDEVYVRCAMTITSKILNALHVHLLRKCNIWITFSSKDQETTKR